MTFVLGDNGTLLKMTAVPNQSHKLILAPNKSQKTALAPDFALETLLGTIPVFRFIFHSLQQHN